MATPELDVRPVTPRIGAEVHGVDLSQPLGNHDLAGIHQALRDHRVLFFRDQLLDHDAHKRFGRHFGELHVHPAIPGPEGHPEILPVHTDANSHRTIGDRWHSDVTCDECPPMGSILYLHTVPDSGGDTLFASMDAAYDALSPRMQAYLADLTARHDGEQQYRGRFEHLGVDDRGRAFPRADHPVIRTHPETGRKSIYVNPVFTTRINELPPDESSAVLAFLHAHCQKPDFQVRFRWRANSVAFWDNRCVQHLALWDYHPHVRSGFRVTVKGDRPV
jgi:taurine dioxygenase